MAKDLSVNILLDFYGELLTPKQQQALDGYYNQDLSLAEIAEDMQVSRQGVRAFIKDGEEHLHEFENKLHLAARFDKISRITDLMADTLSQLSANDFTEKLNRNILQIKQLL